MKLSDLPALNAFLNGLSAILLTMAISVHSQKEHRRPQTLHAGAVTCSVSVF